MTRFMRTFFLKCKQCQQCEAPLGRQLVSLKECLLTSQGDHTLIKYPKIAYGMPLNEIRIEIIRTGRRSCQNIAQKTCIKHLPVSSSSSVRLSLRCPREVRNLFNPENTSGVITFPFEFRKKWILLGKYFDRS